MLLAPFTFDMTHARIAGNPCEQTNKNYRLLVTGMFTHIKTLDFTTITSIDREKADGFYARYLRIKETTKSKSHD